MVHGAWHMDHAAWCKVQGGWGMGDGEWGMREGDSRCRMEDGQKEVDKYGQSGEESDLAKLHSREWNKPELRRRV